MLCFRIHVGMLNCDVVKKQVTIAKTALDACTKAEAIVIATEWKEFQDIAWQKVYDQMNKPAFVFDGRLLIDADALRKIGFKVSATAHLFGNLILCSLCSARSLPSAEASASEK